MPYQFMVTVLLETVLLLESLRMMLTPPMKLLYEALLPKTVLLSEESRPMAHQSFKLAVLLESVLLFDENREMPSSFELAVLPVRVLLLESYRRIP
jgi:hypothetical protein